MGERTNGSFDGITGLRSRQDGTDEREFEREREDGGGAVDDVVDEGKHWLCLNCEECDSWFEIGGGFDMP